MKRPVVSIVGRPNVGKSSLYNRILGRRKALVQDTPGVTRDRNYSLATLEGRDVILCDTGGFEENAVVSDNRMARLIREQALVAIEESDVIVFVMDIRSGLTATDEDIARRLRGIEQPVLYVLNKCDHTSVEVQSADFYRLGVETFHLVSAEHALGVGELIERVVDALPEDEDARGQVPDPWEDTGRSRRKDKGGRLEFLGEAMSEEALTASGPAPEDWDLAGGRPRPAAAHPEEEQLVRGLALDEHGVSVQALEAREHGGEGDFDPEELPPDFEVEEDDTFVPRIALLGRPNVGKSTLLNRLLGYQRSITSPEAGTTHDTVDAYLEHDGKRFVLIDTAGIRRRSKVVERVEQLTVGRSIRTIEATHLCLLVIDSSEGITDQEAKLGALVAERGRSLVLVINKWDLQARGSAPRRDFLERMRYRFPHLSFADVVFVSALNGRGVERIWEAIARANEAHRLTIGTGQLNRWGRRIWDANPPPMHKHRPVRLYYCAQTGIRPPTFVFFCNQPRALAESYRRYVTNQLRASFDCPGSPLRLLFKDRSGA